MACDQANSGLDAIPDPVVRFDRDLRYLWVNRAVTAISGRPREDYVGRTDSEVRGEAAQDPLLEAAVERVFETGQAQTLDLCIDHPRGRRWYESRLAPECDDDGAIRSVLVIARDVSHLKRVEHALQERVKELRCLYRVSTALGAADADLAGALRQVCQAMPSGWQHPELASARVRLGEIEVSTPGFRTTDHAQRATIHIDGEAVGEVELCYSEPRELIAEEQELIGAIATRIGETVERLESERRLQASHAYYEALVSASTDMIGIVDSELRIAFVSPASESLLGRPPMGLVGAPVLDLIHPDDRAQVMAFLRGILGKPNGTATASYRVRRADGSYRSVETTGRNMLHDPSVAGLLTSTRDLSERRELESQLHQAQKMEAVGRLAGGIAHDFNNVLTIIEASAELLAEEMSEHDPRREDVVEIQQASRRAAGLTRRLLAFSRKQVLQPQLLDLSSLVGDMGKLLRRLIGEDVELVTQLEAVTELVRADPGQLEQVLLNLVVNAREAMPRGGRLTIAVEATTDPETGARQHSLVVQDTGVGMTDEVLERIFDPFFTTKETGTGLGLATVYGIVKQSGGFLAVDSTVGRGTTFRISLPIAESGEIAVMDSARPVVGEVSSAHETVLVVEDEKALREVTRRILERRGYQVLTAKDGEDALTVAADPEHHIDLLLVDVVMPGMNGREVVEAIDRIRPGLPVLYTSGYMDDAILRHGLAQSTVRLLSKPFTPDTLVNAVRRALEEAA